MKTHKLKRLGGDVLTSVRPAGMRITKLGDRYKWHGLPLTPLKFHSDPPIEKPEYRCGKCGVPFNTHLDMIRHIKVMGHGTKPPEWGD